MGLQTNTKIDLGLIGAGLLISTVFVAFDGNGTNALRVLSGMLLVAAITGLISFFLSALVRSLGLIILVSVLISDLAFILYMVSEMAHAKHIDAHAEELLALLPFLFVLLTGPTVLSSAVGFSRIAHRFWTARRLKARIVS